MNRWLVAAPVAAAYIGTIFAANAALEHWGFISVGFGYLAGAGVYFAGLALILRDVLHRQVGRWPVLGAIGIGAACSALVSPAFALASAAAFGVSELADLAVYEPLRQRGALLAVWASSMVGLVVDSLLFLYLAFGSIQFWQGQVLGKTYMVFAAVALLALIGRRRAAAVA